MTETSPLPVVVLCGASRADQDIAAVAVALALPAPVCVRHELHVSENRMRRVVSDVTGVVEDVWIPLEHACLTCGLREEIVPTLVRLAGEAQAHGWTSILLDLPAGVDVPPVARAMAGMVLRGRPVSQVVEVRRVVAAVRGGDLLADVFGDDLMRERDGEAFDDRAYGEVLCEALEYADLAACVDGALPNTAGRVLDELMRPGTRAVLEVEALAAEDLLGRRDHAAANRWVATAGRRPAASSVDVADDVVDASLRPEEDVWTVYVDTWRPFHPERLHEELERIGGWGVRSRGCFWLPTRPAVMNAWEGGGGSLSIGTTGPWQERTPCTRIAITGHGPRRDEVAGALRSALMTEAELAAGLGSWRGRGDRFDPWLGAYDDAA